MSLSSRVSSSMIVLKGLVYLVNFVSISSLIQQRYPFRSHRIVQQNPYRLYAHTTNNNNNNNLLTDARLNRMLPADCDDDNTPPSLAAILQSIQSLKSGSDIRGTFVDHKRVGTLLNVYQAMITSPTGLDKALTPFAAYCYGHAFAQMVLLGHSSSSSFSTASFTTSNTPLGLSFLSSPTLVSKEEEEKTILSNNNKVFTNQPSSDIYICVGRDPRWHSTTLADSLCRGIESVQGCKAVYTSLATTPAMLEFCRSSTVLPKIDASVMVTASHLPQEKNGLKFFANFCQGGFTKKHISILAEGASACARSWFQIGLVPPTSGEEGVSCSSWVNFMPHYETTLKNAIVREVSEGLPLTSSSNTQLPLAGLRIVLNAGNGSGSFFQKVLHELGADISFSINLTPDGTFPVGSGVPNPEYKPMIDETIQACELCMADLGIMLDTDADRCGLIVPCKKEDSSSSLIKYEALNRNRLIALLSVIFSSSSPGCTIVTDSVTSEGLSKFLKQTLGLNHVRYLKGYANVIGKAKELTETGQALAEMAIETSGHCAMRENGYLDDGTYTAVKVIGLLARVSRSSHDAMHLSPLSTSTHPRRPNLGLLTLIEELEEMEEVKELRMNVLDGTMESTDYIFRVLLQCIEDGCTKTKGWMLDPENLEGIRVTVGMDGTFFMLRKSLHDPILSLQVEGTSPENVRASIIQPLLQLVEEREKHQGFAMSQIIQLDTLRSY